MTNFFRSIHCIDGINKGQQTNEERTKEKKFVRQPKPFCMIATETAIKARVTSKTHSNEFSVHQPFWFLNSRIDDIFTR